jgi:eukaryotic-like serine/threonine-protein kinase
MVVWLWTEPKMSNAYSEGFKREISRYYRYSGNSLEQISSNVGVELNLLQDWVTQYEDLISEEMIESEMDIIKRQLFSHKKDKANQITVNLDFMKTYFSSADEGDVQEDGFDLISPIHNNSEPYCEVGEVLGEGGMGKVFEATQSSLGRRIAVKKVHDHLNSPAFIRRLLQEAWITGMLEHPNIVPIYDIVEGTDSRPEIIMKKIDGEAWLDVLLDNSKLTRAGSSINLEKNLDIFIQVCHAIEYAHCKNILHRDLKPENIMIGHYGEVYVLDWGIAVALDEGYPKWIPQAKFENRIAGTLGYLAPEMAHGKGELLCVQSDIYLLGAMLYEIVTGTQLRPNPIDPNDLSEIIEAQYEPNPNLDSSLNTILSKTLANSPEDRYQSVADLREEVLKYRSSMEIIELSRQTRELFQKIHTNYLKDEVDRNALFQNLAAARFGVQQIERLSDEKLKINEELKALVLVLVRGELDNERLGSAELLLSQFNIPSGDLSDQILKLRIKRNQSASELERLRVENNQNIGVRTRLLVATIAFILWMSCSVIKYFYEDFSYTTTFWLSAFQIVVFMGLGYWARESLFRTQLNRQSFSALFLLPVILLISDVACYMADFDIDVALSIRHLASSTLLFCFTAFVESKLLPTAFVYSIFTIMLFMYPEQKFVFIPIINVILFINIGIIWLPNLQHREDSRAED